MSFFIHNMLVSIFPMILEVSGFAMLSLILPDLVSVAETPVYYEKKKKKKTDNRKQLENNKL